MMCYKTKFINLIEACINMMKILWMKIFHPIYMHLIHVKTHNIRL
jgi:hypothetical protein